MVAYSFKKRFIIPIRVGLGLDPIEPVIVDDPDSASGYSLEAKSSPKRQTIRAVGKRRHARPGEILQLYSGMRTRQCIKIGEARCVAVRDIVLRFGNCSSLVIGGAALPDVDLDGFARKDGFRHWRDMADFWDKEHGLPEFTGVLIEWEPLPS